MNNGNCGFIEKIVIGMFFGVFVVIIVILSFMDSVKIFSIGKVYYGLVMIKGLWNFVFKGVGIFGVDGVYYSLGGKNYKFWGFDFVNVVMLLVVFVVLFFFMDLVLSCYFKKLSLMVVKMVFFFVSVVILFVIIFVLVVRNGIGFCVDVSVWLFSMI